MVASELRYISSVWVIKTEILKCIYVKAHRKLCESLVPLRAWVLYTSFWVILNGQRSAFLTWVMFNTDSYIDICRHHVNQNKQLILYQKVQN